MLDRSHFETLDERDPLGSVTDKFRLPPGVAYLDGNSLGPLPAHVPGVVAGVTERQWGTDLIRSWNDNGWWTLSRRTGERIAPLIGAPPGSVVAGDTTTVALYKAAWAGRRMRPDRDVILTDSGNFPTDLYALSSVADQTGATLVVVDPGEVPARIGADVALVALTHVDYRTGRRHPLAQVTAASSDAGAVMLWDLSHSTGAMVVDVQAADLAVGCGYKYLNGGPGAPAYTYVNPAVLGDFANPVRGWWGHAEPFAMVPGFEAAADIGRTQVGTQPILSLAALHAALDVFEDVDLGALEAKSQRLVADFIHLVDQRLEGFEVVTPRDPGSRGSHVSLAHPRARRIMAALVERDVIGDVRPPDLLRFGLAPAFQRHVDVWDAVEALSQVMAGEEWRRVTVPEGSVT